MMMKCLAKKISRKVTMQTSKSLAMATFTLVIAGCSSVDTLTKTENGASYEYLIGEFETIEIVDMAKEHCGKYGKHAELTNRYSDAHRVFNTLIFNCS